MHQIPQNNDPLRVEYKTLSADYPFYVKRFADEELLRNLSDGSLCYVFNARRTGKSSLIAKVRQELENNSDFICMTVSINNIGVKEPPTKFYSSIIDKMLENQKQEFYEAILTYKFKRQDLPELPEYQQESERLSSVGKTLDYRDFLQWFAKKIFDEWFIKERSKEKTPKQIFTNFINEMLLRVGNPKILIIFDEIDAFLSIDNAQDTFLENDKNEFFTFIRECHNDRSQYERLVFCLIGCVTPTALINDPKTTPFNTAIPIDLKYFEIEKSAVLVDKLNMKKIKNPKEILKRIFYWTSGQPYLTQRLCDIADQNQITLEEINLEDQVFTQHFNHIEQYINGQDIKGSILKLYAEILEYFENEQEPLNFNSSEEEILLCLSGLVVNRRGKIEISNRIIVNKFNKEWVTNEINSLRAYPKELALQWESIQDKSLLLKGIPLQEANAWIKRMCGKIDKVDYNFIYTSTLEEDTSLVIAPKQLEIDLKTVILNMSQRLVSITTQVDNLGSEILTWTNRDFDLSKFICELIDFTPPMESIETEVRKWIEQNIINNWQNSSLAEKIGTIQNCLLDSEHSSRRLKTYQKILEGESPSSDDRIDAELLTSGLITQDNDGLRVGNKIYESIFNLEWVKKYLSPYTNSLISWQSSGCQDKSYLLNDEDLQKALNWIQNKDKLSEPELIFIINSAIWANWQSDEVVNQVKEFLLHLKEKTYTYTHLIKIIQAIVIGTRPQLVFLKDVLQWVISEDIPDVNEVKWLEILVRSHLEYSTAQNISEYLDFNNPYNQTWGNLKSENAFKKVDNFTNVSQTSVDDRNNVKNYFMLLDLYQVSRQNESQDKSLTNFHPLISNVLYRKFKQAYNMAGQKEFDQLLDKIVEEAGGDIEAIIIFDLTEGLPLYHNKGLKDRNLKLYAALFGEGDDMGEEGGVAIEGFATLNKIQEAFNNFGEQTEFGNQKSMLVNFASGKMMIYFHQAPDIPTAICFMASKEINLGSINRKVNQVIQEIKNKLGDL